MSPWGQTVYAPVPNGQTNTRSCLSSFLPNQERVYFFKEDNSRLPFPLSSPESPRLVQTPNNDYRWHLYTLCMNIWLFRSKSSTYPLQEPLCSVSATPPFCLHLCVCAHAFSERRGLWDVKINYTNLCIKFGT